MNTKRRRIFPYRIYTTAEWEAIERALQSAQSGPLTEVEMASLYFASSLYRATPDFWKVICKWDREDCEGWRNVALHLAEAKKHLEILEEYSDFTKHVARDCLASLEPLREKAEFLAVHRPHAGTKFFDDIAKDQLCKILPKDRAKLAAHNSNNQRSVFYEKIADLWEGRGGKLGITWNSYAEEATKRVSGPFVDFFEAVAKPVMGPAMPTRHTIRDIVRALKRRRGAFREYVETMGTISEHSGVNWPHYP